MRAHCWKGKATGYWYVTCHILRCFDTFEEAWEWIDKQQGVSRVY